MKTNNMQRNKNESISVDRVFFGIICGIVICSLIMNDKKREIIHNDHVGKASPRRGWISVLLVSALTNLSRKLRGD